MSDEMKKPLGENLALYRPLEVAHVNWSGRCASQHFCFILYIFLEIQVMEEWRVQLDSNRWWLSQDIPDLWIKQKISDACLSVIIFLCIFAVQ